MANEKTALEDKIFEELVDIIEKANPKINIDRVGRAYRFARDAHEGQFRMSGIAYICHPVETAKILAKLGVDEETIVAGLLHDVPEDTKYSISDLEKRFGKHVSKLVFALTKLSKVYYKHSMGERQGQSLRKMFLETAKDPRVVIIKLADRLHNMKTLQYLRPEKQQRIAKETMEIYAPLANLFGIYQLMRELEDYCFMYLQPYEHARIQAFVHDYEKERTNYIKESVRVFNRFLSKENIDAKVEGRPKHLYSIYQKTIRDKKILQDIYDYFALRIITNNKEDCYRALGVIHENFKPKPMRFKDYISLPKTNGYQSLHTTVIGMQGKLTEVQIRTEDMHKHAELGAAAHIYYKSGTQNLITENFARINQYKNSENFFRSLQEDLLQSRIFVFSPTGEIIDLPEGATCLDYVYAVGLETNTKVFRAIVNNKNYSLIGQLQSGDRIEIIYGRKVNNGPERWWLDHVKTTLAREAISDFFKRQSEEERIKIGSQLLQQELNHENLGSVYQISKKKMFKAMEHFGSGDFAELLIGIGEGTFESNDVYKIMYPNLNIGITNRLYEAFYSLRAYFGINQTNDPFKYKIKIIIDAYDREGIFPELLQPFYELKIPIMHIRGFVFDRKEKNGGKRVISRDIVDIAIDNHEQLIALFDRVEKIPDIIRVQRIFRKYQVGFFLVSMLTAIYFVVQYFLLKTYHDGPAFDNMFLADIIVLSGLFTLFALFAWLKSMGNKTFPHFEETKYFWPVSFGLSIFSITSVFIYYRAFELNLYMPLIVVVSSIILIFLVATYYSHQKQRLHHLSHLKRDEFAMKKKKKE
ncbi:bifunctional (p)ppGpp synthetase/guanosine-3',5'-bis(diphosphate) 3'-pyrophosphohydrolase [Candidatus Peregrinibacteria bacterium]|nr:bifunctional (p)ppGpp synthetase/guanosine-3',5'-bis(diphosphate) 3'-pyrophosphohydrolase [Candidatus Peregrinibacteria bacterium]